MKPSEKMEEALDALQHALSFEKQAAEDNFYLNGIAKSFEVAVEYGWKHLQRAVNEEGLEAYGPKDSVRAAAQLGLINDPQGWLDAVNTRNLSVHDYLKMPRTELLPIAKMFLLLGRKLMR